MEDAWRDKLLHGRLTHFWVSLSKGTEDWGWERELVRRPDWREQLIAEVEDSPIGFIQIIDPAREDGHYWGDCPAGLRAIDIWIGEEKFLGRGLGDRTLQGRLTHVWSYT